MKTALLCGIMLGGLAAINDPASGQTNQNGPYYANPSWDQQIPAAQRFIVLTNWNSEAVLDRETGLVWQRTPQDPSGTGTYQQAAISCYQTKTGGRFGWRLPALEELMSLVDPTQSNPALPAGHPFQQILPAPFYWSASTRFPPTETTSGVTTFGDLKSVV